MEFKQREILPRILKLIDIPEIIVLHGARQVGKTTLMKMLIDHLQQKNIHNIFYFDLEKADHFELCNKGDEEIIKYIHARTKSEKEKKFLFIDEIQYLDNPSSLLKIFYDHHKEEFKLFVSGSSSFSIKSKFKDSLVGRIIDFEIHGLSFLEFLQFKGLDYDLNSGSEFIHKELKELYREFVLYGSYPQVVLTNNLELKELYINGIIEKYIYKDIKDIARIREVDKFNNLIKFLASQSGQLVNINEISDTLNLSRPTLEKYLFILKIVLNDLNILLLCPLRKVKHP